MADDLSRILVWAGLAVLGVGGVAENRRAQDAASRSATRRFTYVDLDGQDCLIGCATDDERARLERVTGSRVSWLT